MRPRRVVTGRILVAVCGTIGLLVYLWPSIVHEILEVTPCSKAESEKAIQQLCAEYNSGILSGDFCPQLCHKQPLNVDCLNHRVGKMTLLFTKGRTKIVLKSLLAYFQDYSVLNIPATDDDFFKLARKQFQLQLKIPMEIINWESLKSNLLFHYENDIKKHKSQAWKRSLWTLLQQEEFMMMKYFQKYKHIPNVVGTCGHFYALQYLPSPKELESLYGGIHRYGRYYRNADWNVKAKTALLVLDAVKEFDSMSQGPLHVCDLKMGNFGLEEGNVLKLIDVDQIFLDAGMSAVLSQRSCDNDAQCTVMHCTAFCNVTANRCMPYRSNSNMQLACEHLFQNHYINVYSGLLESPPFNIKEELDSVLSDCVRVVREPTHHAEMDQLYHTELYRLIRLGLKEQTEQYR